MNENYIADICKFLKIDVPKVAYDTSHFSTKTMLAQCKRDIIYIKNTGAETPDVYFAIATSLGINGRCLLITISILKTIKLQNCARMS